ncbi:class I SAM-dependent methyltransferase [Chondromyces crocatus]|uniref:class I SAM-dependent methyltransferase n=1 Tax=Chondromyces crocatus TaxID=52 RepID=UPI001FE1B193|nr:class I SAM-dependent methyltransferase [Chondromyces crocatus]
MIRSALFALHHRTVSVPRAERVATALANTIGHAGSLLDIGAGDGVIARDLAQRVGAQRVAGVDVKLRPDPCIDVVHYDGEQLPFPDGAFEIVVLSDVLHHCARPAVVLSEALRVATRAVAIKDHFRFGPLSDKILLAMDVAGNAAPGVLVRGTYFSPADFVALVEEAGGRVADLTWPLRIHDLPFRLITWDRLQFAARIEHAREDAPLTPETS